MRSTPATTRSSGRASSTTLERLGAFAMFRSPWFSLGLLVLVISIVICTLDRTPRLWRQVRDARVVQPEPFYDPMLPGPGGDARRLRGRPGGGHPRSAASGSRPRRPRTAFGTSYGDRHQYTKLATLLTHPGSSCSCSAAAVTSRFGRRAGPRRRRRRVADGPADRNARAAARQEPRLRGARLRSGRPTDFTTDLAVYRDGQEIARKTIRVNDPLSVGGLHVPPERVRARAAPGHPRRGRASRSGTGRCR